MIYLLRHFEVFDKTESMMDSKRFNQWVKEYDTLMLNYSHVTIPTVDHIYCSSLQRCINTAEYLNKNIIVCDNLVEVESKAAFTTSLKLPKTL